MSSQPKGKARSPYIPGLKLLGFTGSVSKPPGVFLTGTGAGPMGIPETVSHASGAAAQVLKLFSQ